MTNLYNIVQSCITCKWTTLRCGVEIYDNEKMRNRWMYKPPLSFLCKLVVNFLFLSLGQLCTKSDLIGINTARKFTQEVHIRFLNSQWMKKIYVHECNSDLALDILQIILMIDYNTLYFTLFIRYTCKYYL